MICPECGYGYRPGFMKCSDCDVDLVHESQYEAPSDEPQFVEFRELLYTYNPFDISLVKSILDAEGIQHFFKGEQFSLVRPLAEPSRLMVRDDQAEEAREILADLDLTIVASNGIDGMYDDEDYDEEDGLQ